MWGFETRDYGGGVNSGVHGSAVWVMIVQLRIIFLSNALSI